MVRAKPRERNSRCSFYRNIYFISRYVEVDFHFITRSNYYENNRMPMTYTYDAPSIAVIVLAITTVLIRLKKTDEDEPIKQLRVYNIRAYVYVNRGRGN